MIPERCQENTQPGLEQVGGGGPKKESEPRKKSEIRSFYDRMDVASAMMIEEKETGK